MESKTILLVEDNINDVLLIQRAYRKAGIANPLQVVRDGQAAVDYLAGQGSYADREQFPFPAVVLLDIKLPRKSGLEVLAWMRQEPNTAHLPVVILTSSEQSADIRQAYERGVNSYLVKPVSPDTMLEMIKTLGIYWLAMNKQPLPE